MITAVDTSVLVDIFRPDPEFGPRSSDALRTARSEGSLIACDVVWAEVCAGFEDEDDARRALDRLGVVFEPLDGEIALRAGRLWRSYRSRSRSRVRIVPDFLIGAHADARADRLLTRDRGFYRTYFKRLAVMDPTRAQRA